MENIKKIKNKCDQEYFENGISIIPDYEYDLIDNLIQDVENIKIEKIPAKAGKTKLPINMFSLNKVWDFSKIHKTKNVVLMDKLDGISCLIYKGKTYTRGNGIYGHEINIIKKKYTSSKLLNDYAIRGEIVVSKKKLDKEKYTNTRTMANSFVARNEKSQFCDFVAYELISLQGEDLSPEQQLKILQQNNYNVVYNCFVEDLTEDFLNNFLNLRLKNSEYDIDGIVLNFSDIIRTSRNLTANPKHAIAFKKNFKGVDTTIIDIKWNLGTTGIYIPVLHINKIEISGSKISKVTGHNLNYLKRKKIGIGSKVEIVKSGQVIPHVVNVYTYSSNYNLPKDADQTTGMLISPLNENLYIQSKKLLFFATHLKIMGIGPKKAEEFTSFGITPHKIITEGISIFNSFEGKNNEKIILNIKTILKNVDDLELLVAMRFFGDRIGISKASKIILNEEAINILNHLKRNFKNINTKENFKDKINTEVLEACISGTRKTSDEDIIKKLGFKPTYTITKKTKKLFVFGNKSSNKISKAQKLNIEIIYM